VIGNQKSFSVSVGTREIDNLSFPCGSNREMMTFSKTCRAANGEGLVGDVCKTFCSRSHLDHLLFAGIKFIDVGAKVLIGSDLVLIFA